MAAIASTILGIILATTTVLPSLELGNITISVAEKDWVINHGDKILIDTKNNVGYLFNDNGKYLRFDIVTGQRKYVSYIGRYYNAATPNWNWIMTSKDIKPDRLTFGPTGEFLRLYKEGEDRTAYGIHAYGDEEEIFTGLSTRFRSMGCIIVRSNILDIILDTWELNNEYLLIKSIYGIEDLAASMKEVAENV